MPTNPDNAAVGKRDAKVLSLILKGKLTETSSVDDGAGGPAIPLGEHPRYANLLQLTRAALSARVLEQSEWWTNREAEWSASLEASPIWELLYQISREHLTGVLALKDGDRSKAIAFSSGLALSASSALPHEAFESFLLAREHFEPSQINSLEALCREKSQSLEWGLLYLGVMAPDAILEVLQHQARTRILDLFTWRTGEATFYADQRAAQLSPVINMPLLRMFRRGFFGTGGADADGLRTLLAPLTQTNAPLALGRPLGTLEFVLQGLEGAVIAAARKGQSAAEFIAHLEQEKPRDLADGLGALYVFYQMGSVGLDAEKQPTLPLPGTLHEGAQPPPPEGASAAALGAMGLSSINSSHADIPEDSAIASLLASSEHVRPPGATDDNPSPEAPSQEPAEPGEVLANLQEQRQLETEGRRLLNSKQPEDAVKVLQQAVALQKRPTDTFAYLAVALLLRNHPGDRDKAKQLATDLIETDRESALGHAAMSRVQRALRERNASRRLRARAYTFAKGSDQLEREVLGLIEIGQDLEKITLTTFHKRRSPLVDTASVDAMGWALVALVFLLLFALANPLGAGKHEYFYDPANRFFYFRRLVLLAAGIGGTFYLTRGNWRDVLASFGWDRHGPLILLGLVLGVGVGYVSPAQRVTSGFAVVAALTVLHVLAEEVFFRGYVTNLLLGAMPQEPFGAAVMSGMIFGVYHLTYYSFWYETDLLPKLYYVAAISLLAGVPYAWLYIKSKSLITPLVCHTAVNLTMMYFSTLGAGQ